MMTLSEAQEALARYGPGRVAVIYHSERRPEHGVITGVNDTYVFVRYGRKGHGQATRPEHLVFAPAVTQ